MSKREREEEEEEDYEEEEEEEEDSFDIDDYHDIPKEPSSPEKVHVVILEGKRQDPWGHIELSHSDGITVKQLQGQAFERKGLVDGKNCHRHIGGYVRSKRLKDDDIVAAGTVLIVSFFRFGGVMRFYPGEACIILPEDDYDKKSKYIFCYSVRLNSWNYAWREYVFPELMACAPREYFKYEEKTK